MVTTTSTSDAVLAERDGRTLMLTINRPGAKNALTADVAQALARAITDIDDDIRAIILTGAGDAFCAGGDLQFLLDTAKSGAAKVTEAIYTHFHALVHALLGAPVPVVAAINGPAIGAGLDLALACDFRIAASSAKLASAWIRLGLATGMGGTWLLARAVGGTRAAEIALLGETISAERAEAIGLVTRTVADDRLKKEAEAVAERLSKLPSAALSATRASLHRALDAGLAEELHRLGKVQGELIASDEFAAAARRILDKKP